MNMLAASRRRFFALVSATPLAAKAALDDTIGQSLGLTNPHGMGNSSSNYGSGGVPSTDQAGPSPRAYVPYEQRLLRSSDYLKVTGIPAWMEESMRDQCKYITSLDPDIAAKRSWSMSVKIQEQRQRNYERMVRRIHRSAWHQRGRNILNGLLGFEWPY